MIIKDLSAKKIKDSRKDYTLEVTVNGKKASSPNGKSTSKYSSALYRKSLEQSSKDINSLKFDFEINSFKDLKKLESYIKKKFKLTDVKKFGANALFALESAILKALAKEQKKELWQIIDPKATLSRIPVPVGNVIGGGLHSHNKNSPEFQEFLIIPHEKSFKNNVKVLNKIHKKIKRRIPEEGKNDEGAWQTSLSNGEILYTLAKIPNLKIGIDIAASSFYKNKDYLYRRKSLNPGAQIHYINSLIKRYNLFYIEDPLSQEDFKGFSKITRQHALIVGDDLTASNLARAKKAIKEKSINAMIIKPNQNGSLIEIKNLFALCKKHEVATILSHRSGETNDDALADYAFGFGADFIKTGISGRERKVKLKRLIKIEKSLYSKVY